MTRIGSHCTISNAGNGMVLDAEDCCTANGAVVRRRPQSDNARRQWNITLTGRGACGRLPDAASA